MAGRIYRERMELADPIAFAIELAAVPVEIGSFVEDLAEILRDPPMP